MSFGAVLSYILGVLAPAALLCACVFELLARRMAKDRRADPARLARRRQGADIALVAAWLLLAAAYMSMRLLAPDRAELEEGFIRFMTWMLIVIVVIDILYLYLRRARPRPEGKKKRFWEI